MRVRLAVPELVGHITYDFMCDACDTAEEFSVQTETDLAKMVSDAGWTERDTGAGRVDFCPEHRALAEWTKVILGAGDKRYIRKEPKNRKKRRFIYGGFNDGGKKNVQV